MPSPTPRTTFEVLTPDQRTRLAREPDLAARFSELADTAMTQGPGRPGGSGRNPFWNADIGFYSLDVEKLFNHAAYTVGLDRVRVSRVEAA